MVVDCSGHAWTSSCLQKWAINSNKALFETKKKHSCGSPGQNAAPKSLWKVDVGEPIWTSRTASKKRYSNLAKVCYTNWLDQPSVQAMNVQVLTNFSYVNIVLTPHSATFYFMKGNVYELCRRRVLESLICVEMLVNLLQWRTKINK